MGLDLGFFEILVILVVTLLVVGPEKLPEYARKFGKIVRDLRKMTKNFTGEVTRSLDLEDDFDDLKNTAQGLKGSLDEESLKIKNALDMEAEEIAKTIDDEVSGVKKIMDDGTAEIADMLEKESREFDTTAREIKDPLAREAQEVSSTLNESVDKINKSLNIENASPAIPSKKTKKTGEEKKEAKKTPDIPEDRFNPFDSRQAQTNLTPPANADTTAADKKTDTEETEQ
ncbi:MAG TPA: twin-arginine translocase subunit TatB [Dehalococcoidia bacterium]|nr:twin-arginine translocase subunit TatB [Dehalococcoidia bacterium]